MKYKNLRIIGTSHIAQESIDEVKKAIETDKPSVIAVELDFKRYEGLKSSKRRGPSLSDIRRIGLSGYIFLVIGAYAQKKLGRYVNIEPGSEMLAAIKIAKKNNLRIELIDGDIEITLARFSKFFTFREKLRIVGDLLGAIFFARRELKKLGIREIDLSKVPSKKLINVLIGRLKERYPNIYKVLIEERNVFMASRLKVIMEKEQERNIVCVVGAGHMEGILELLKKNEPKAEGMRAGYSFTIIP